MPCLLYLTSQHPLQAVSGDIDNMYCSLYSFPNTSWPCCDESKHYSVLDNISRLSFFSCIFYCYCCDVEVASFGLCCYRTSSIFGDTRVHVPQASAGQKQVSRFLSLPYTLVRVCLNLVQFHCMHIHLTRPHTVLDNQNLSTSDISAVDGWALWGAWERCLKETRLGH